ncbi:hypothetical protein Dda_8210 [Drechslerella dactyloides]|uniref:Uncharacterized protein n=1 Tax=Drechslerella dactyloides TaxID=74499 RepID=A0AAD6NFA6_DREDA|nr:hypothetical protein Dda_8210 [Drechslerella dactyloides]
MQQENSISDDSSPRPDRRLLPPYWKAAKISVLTRIADRIRRKIQRYQSIRRERAEGPSILVDLIMETSRPEAVGANRNPNRPWTREIRRLLKRLRAEEYQQFMIHRAHGYHGMVCPQPTSERYERAYEIGKLERRWEDASAQIEARTSIGDEIFGSVELRNMADFFQTSQDFDAPSSDEASSYKAFR